jgi:peptide/nickel transport system substrate-binding protein
MSKPLGHSRRDFLKLGGATAAAAFGAPLLAACSGSSSSGTSSSAASGRLVIGVAGDPTTLDPGTASQALANEIIKNTYAQWTKYAVTDTGKGYLQADSTHTAGDALASYTVDSDGVTVHCTVRSAKFPSGNPVTADDFIYTAKRALATKQGPVFDFNTIGITDPGQLTKVSDTEFTMKLAAPSAILGPMLRDQDAGLLDAKAIAAHATTDDPWALKWMAANSLGGGAYLLDSFKQGSQVVLKADPAYWGAKPHFTSIVLQEVASPDDRALLLKNGTIDIAEGLSLDGASQLAGAAGVKLYDIPSRNQDLFGLVQTHAPFDDVRVRQAVAYAIDYASLAKNVLKGYASAPKAVWPQNSVYFDAAQTWPYSYDPAKAKSLLAAAGHASGLSFTCEVNTDDADANALAVSVQTALAQVGVTMNIAKVAAATFQQHLTQKSMQAWIYSGLGDYVDDPYYHLFLWFTSTANLNWFGFVNTGLDALAAQLHTELDLTKRKALAGQAQQILNDQLPAIVLSEPHFVLPTRSDIGGLLIEPDLLLRYNTLTRS